MTYRNMPSADVLDSGAFTADEIRELRALLEIEKIKKVKLLYAQLMDSRRIDELIEICTDDCVCEFGPYGTWNGKKAIHEGWTGVFKDATVYGGFHATTNMWVELSSPTTARALTYLHDISHEPDPRSNPVIWYGVYDEDYRKENGQWRMSRCALQFLWPKRQTTQGWPEPFPFSR